MTVLSEKGKDFVFLTPWPGKGAHLLLWALNMAGNAVWFKALLKSVAKGDKLAREEKDGAGRKKGAAAPAKRD